MKAIRRHVLATLGVVALSATAAPLALLAQAPRGQPDANTPRLLVATFFSADRNLGVQGSDAVRTRVSQEVPPKQLWVISKNDINNTLEASGYKADSALSANDLKELAKLLRADEILDGTITRSAGGIRVAPRLMLARDVSLAQPLPPVEAKDPGAAARQIEKSLGEARKQMADYRRCENALRDQKWSEAIAAANAGIAKYSNSTLSRLCLMSAYQYGKMGPDSVLRAANSILAIDSTSTLALRNSVDAYNAKADTAKAVQTMVRLSRLDPSVRSQIIPLLGGMGKPELALPIVAEMLNDNPGDPQLLRMRFALLASASRYKEALAAADEYLKADTSAANPEMFTRLVAIASADSQPQLASQYAARGAQKFASNADVQMLYAQALRKSGQLQQAIPPAKRAVELNPKIPNGALFVIVTYNELNLPDSALAYAKTAIAAGADKATIGQALLAPVGAAAKAAQEAKTREAWMKTFQMASIVDSISPSPQTKYFIGVSSFQVGYDALQNLNKTKSCADATLAEDMWATAQINMPAGAQVDANTAGQIMAAIQQYSAAITQAKKAVCKGTGRGAGSGR